MRTVGWSLCLLLVGAPVAADIAETVEDFETAEPGPAQGWTLRGTNGWASKMVIVEQARPGGGKRHLRLDYDFTKSKQDGTPVEGLKYIICNTRIPLPRGTNAISVDVLGDRQDHSLVLSVTDAEGEWFNFGVAEVRWEGWRTLTVPIAGNFHSHGRGDGVIQQPLFFSSFNVTGDPRFAQEGSLGFDNIVAHRPAGIKHVVMQPVAPAERLFPRRASAEMRIWLKNQRVADARGELEYAIHRGVGGPGDQPPLAAGMTTWECAAEDECLIGLTVPTSEFGYYRLEGRLISDDGERVPLLTSYAVLPEPSADRALTFGIGTFYEGSVLGGKLAEAAPVIRRLGASWSIAFLSWRKIEPEAGEYDWAEHDEALAAWPADGPALLAALGHFPDRCEVREDADDATVERVRGEFEAGYRSAVVQAAARYADKIKHWGLLHIGRRYYGRAGAEGGEMFAKFLAGTQRALLDAAPDVTVASEIDLPAAELWQAEDAPNECAQLQALYSEILYHTAYRPDEADEVVAGFDGLISGWRADRPLWLANGAFVWRPKAESAQTGPGAAEPHEASLEEQGERELVELSHANVVVKTLALAHYAAPDAHLHWWRLQDDKPGGAGLIGADGSPKPAACAFATVCRLLPGARPLQDWSDERIRAVVFGRNDVMTLVAWSLDGGEHSLELRGDQSLEVVSLLGASKLRQPIEGTIELTVAPIPRFVVGSFELRPEEAAPAAAAIPAEAVKHCEAGMALKHEGRTEEAAEELRAALKLAPDCVDAHWGLAWVCAELGDKGEAIAHFREVIRLAPDTDLAREAVAAIERLR